MLIVPPALPLPDAPAALVLRHAAGGADVWHQIGPNPRPMEPSPLPIPRRKPVTEVPPPVPGAAQSATQTGIPAAAPVRPAQSRYARCLAAGDRDPAAAIAAARAWLAETPTSPANAGRGAAAQCLGQLLVDSGDFAGAESAFADSAAQVPATDAPTLSALQAMAGNAALAGGKADEALAWFDKALAPAPAAADVKTTPAAPTNEALGAVQIDRARAGRAEPPARGKRRAGRSASPRSR
jgi:hypothetical protein